MKKIFLSLIMLGLANNIVYSAQFTGANPFNNYLPNGLNNSFNRHYQQPYHNHRAPYSQRYSRNHYNPHRTYNPTWANNWNYNNPYNNNYYACTPTNNQGFWRGLLGAFNGTGWAQNGYITGTTPTLSPDAYVQTIQTPNTILQDSGNTGTTSTVKILD